MRLGPAIHGVLLALVLVFAYKTWTREKPVEPKGGDIVVWTESADSFESLVFEGKNKKIVIERRADNAGTYLWGSVTKTQSKVAKPDPHGGHGGHGGHGAPPKSPTPPKDGAAPTPPKGGASPGPAPKGGAKPAPTPKKKGATPAPKKKAPAPDAAKGKPDGKKANQNDPIPQDPGSKAKPAKPKPANAKPPSKPKPTPAKPGATPTPAKPAPATAGDKAATDLAAPAAGAGTPAPKKPAPAGGEKQTTVRQFPIGDAGTKLVTNITNLRALRALGVPNDDQKIEYGLDETEETLTIKFKGGVEHVLLVGDRAFGSSDRYVLEKASGKGYVLSSQLMKNFDSSEATLGLKKYNDFDLKEDLAQLSVDIDGATQTLLRLEIEEEAKPGDKKPPKTRLTWARKEAPKTEDVTMANFVDRASKLRPVEYMPDLSPGSLTLIARFEYGGKDGKPIGFLDFYKGADPHSDKPDVTEYFMRTERTRVLGKVSKLTAERVDQDLAEVFGTSPAEEAPQPTE